MDRSMGGCLVEAGLYCVLRLCNGEKWLKMNRNKICVQLYHGRYDYHTVPIQFEKW